MYLESLPLKRVYANIYCPIVTKLFLAYLDSCLEILLGLLARMSKLKGIFWNGMQGKLISVHFNSSGKISGANIQACKGFSLY